MPQPLSKVHPKATVILGYAEEIFNPEFTTSIFQVVNTWAVCEHILSHLISRFVKGDFEIVTAMFHALSSSEARRDALFAAAQKALSREDFNLIRATMRAAKPTRDQRNCFVHHIWGYSPEIPDAMVLADPTALSEHILDANRSFLEIWRGKPPRKLVDYDHSKIFVYRENDFFDAVANAKNAYEWFFKLFVVIGAPVPAHDTIRNELLSQPPIRQHFEKFAQEGSP